MDKRRWVPAFALPAIVGLAVSACSTSGSGAPGLSAVPASNSPAVARVHGFTSGAQGVRNGLARMAQAVEGRVARGRKHSNDYTHPSNVTTADPPVVRPNETPCTVTLFSGFKFTNFTYPTFSFVPPSNCPGPWAKVVFEGDFSVTAGRQFDRTASVWIAGTNVYFGTTAEPSANLSPSWHVERDVTDLSAIFKAPSTGEVVLGNVVDSTYTGIISASGKLQFYRANASNPAPLVADNVYPLSAGALGDNQYLKTQQQPLNGTFTFGRNVDAAYLDVYLQSQIGDEFWYACFPNDLAAQIPNCGNTAFREGDVAIDGRPAGVAPVYPWIYTGGFDPYLWRPIPGVEALEFKPYRVNLTPFAALLDDGNPHTVTVNVFNNGNYFAANGALLVYRDHGSSRVTGALVNDATALYPSPSVAERVAFDSNDVGRGTVSVYSSHPVVLDGFVNTSRGRIETQVVQSIAFSNQQAIEANPSETIYDQSIKQSTGIRSVTTTILNGAANTLVEQKNWPLNLVYDFVVNPDGSASQYTAVSQGKYEKSVSSGGSSSYLDDTVSSSDTLTFPASGGYYPSGGKSTQTYAAGNSSGYCYAKTVTSANYVITGSSGGFCGGALRRVR